MNVDALIYLVIMILIGYIGVRTKLLPGTAIDALPPLLTNLCYPAMIIMTFTTLDTNVILSSGLAIALYTFVVTLLLYLIARIIFRQMDHSKRVLFQFILGIGNVTYVGIPIISIFFGSEGVTYALIHGVVQDVLIWILYYPTFLGKEKGSKRSLWKNPCMIAMAIALLLSAFPYELPSFINYSLEKLSSLSSPIALLFLGGLLSKYGGLGWRKNASAITVSISKILIIPIILFILLTLCTSRYNALLLSVLFGCPAPIMSIIWCKQYEGDVKLSIDCCICSTLFYLIFSSSALWIISTFCWF